METALTILKKNLKSKGLDQKATASLVSMHIYTWLQTRAPTIASEVTVVRLQKGQLVLTGTHSIILQELRGLTVELKEFVNNLQLICIDEITILRK